MLSIRRAAGRGLAGAIVLGLLLAGCMAAGPAPTPTATVRVVIVQAPTATALVPAGVATPRPDQLVQVTDHFVIYYTADVLPTHVANVARYLEAAWREIPPFLGLEPPSRYIRVYMGLETENSTASATGVIVIEPSSLLDGYGVVPHEFTHILTGPAGTEWMGEGLATYMQERFPPGPYSCYDSISCDSWSIGLLRADKWVTLWEFPLGQSDDTSWAVGSARARAYWESGSFVKYLIETYGLPSFWEMYDDPSGWIAAEWAYGRDIDALIEEWRQHLESSTIPPEDCAECIAGYLERSDQSIQMEQAWDRLSREALEQVGREYVALDEAFCRKDAPAMQRHLETVWELLQVESKE